MLPAHAVDTLDPTQALTQYRIDGWKTDQGLPLDTVQALLQTRDGYLWVGTGGGLARFDGLRFATFESAEVPQLASRSIYGLMEDAQGNLWVGHSEGAAIYRDGHFRAAFGSDVTNGRRVWAFAQAPDGAVWAATENGLVQWQHGSVRKVYRVADGLPTDRLRSVAFDRDGTLWIGSTGGGLVSFDGRRFTALTPENGFPHIAVRSVLADPAGGVWAATAGGGLARVHRGSVTTYTTADGLPTDQLTSLTRDARGSLWIGTWGAGVVRLRDGRFTSLSAEQGLAGDQLWSVHADREGSIWAGTWVGGLNRLRSRHFVVLGTPEGLSNDNARAVLHARDGSTWVSTAGGGVSRIHGGTITSIGMKDGLLSDEASTLLEDRDGSIWIGTYTTGVARLRAGRIDTFGAAEGLPSLDVRVLFQDRRGTVWASTTSGLARFDGARFVRVTEPGAPAQGASAILEDRSGTLWMGSDEGLVRYRNGVFTRLTRADGLVANWVMSLYEDADGALWIGSNSEGLNRLKAGRLTAIRPSDGLWDGLVQAILEDRHGNLWITCNRGFYRVARAELNAFAEGRVSRVTSVPYGPGEALRSTTFAGGLQPAGAVDRSGRLWLPSFSGLVIVDPANLPGSGDPPAVRFEEITLDGKPVNATSGVVLPPGSRPLSIRYTATPLRSAAQVRFRYRMEGGASNAWVQAGARREAFFPTLPHGEYRFRLAASTDGTRWREAAAPLVITVKPYFFQTRWFFAAVAIALLAAIAAFLRLRTRQLRRRQREMERLVAEKTEELRLANEHLARLSFVDALTGLANRRRFDEALQEEWARARRFGTPLAVIVADVDLFKAYNDSLGHPAGDRCLAAVGEIFLNANRRAGELVARYGGEEFVALIHADEAGAVAFAEQLRRACEARAIPHPASPVAPHVTISLGVASCVPDESMSAATLVAEADAALYRAKHAGRNRVSTSPVAVVSG
ncbi:MAG TPA: two-component regulator propeller domain-containing protein [Thermoanaerobaculia bacterium]